MTSRIEARLARLEHAVAARAEFRPWVRVMPGETEQEAAERAGIASPAGFIHRIIVDPGKPHAVD
jgi:hypothetical protein